MFLSFLFSLVLCSCEPESWFNQISRSPLSSVSKWCLRSSTKSLRPNFRQEWRPSVKKWDARSTKLKPKKRTKRRPCRLRWFKEMRTRSTWRNLRVYLWLSSRNWKRRGDKTISNNRKRRCRKWSNFDYSVNTHHKLCNSIESSVS
jgi:hypothetical protein